MNLPRIPFRRENPALRTRPALRLGLALAVACATAWVVQASSHAPGAGAPERLSLPHGVPPIGAQALIGMHGRLQEARGELQEHEWVAYGTRGGLALLGLPLLFWVVRRPRTVNAIAGPGFEVISPTERRRFIPLEERFQTLDFVSRIDTVGQLRLSANLNKVTLSVRKYGYLMEDKNYRNALLVNRRRVRRTLLRDGDVLDLGDLTLLYRDLRASKIVRHSSITPAEGKSQIRFQRLKGPIRRGMPMLVPEQVPGRVFYVTKNKVYLGRSESNDLVIKARNVYYRHAKLERVGGRWKLQDLSILGNTFVNNRRIEQRFLKDGDEIAIESHRFKFGFVTRAMRERPPASEPVAVEDADDVASEALATPEGGDGGEDTEFASIP